MSEHTLDASCEKHIYAQASSEFDSSDKRDPGLWAKAYAKAEGNADIAKALYIKYRAEELIAAQHSLACNDTLQRVIPPDDDVVYFQSDNFPDHYIGHRDHLGYILPYPGKHNDDNIRFRIVLGLAGTGTLSFQSAINPRYYLRHSNSEVNLCKRDDTESFNNDSSFFIKNNNFGFDGCSMESLNFPKHFIRHMNSRLYLHKSERNDLFGHDATFHIRNELTLKHSIPLPPNTFQNKPSSMPPKADYTNTIIIVIILGLIFGVRECNNFKMKKKISDAYRNHPNQWQR